MAKTLKPIFTETNCETGEVIERPMTDEEFAAYTDFCNRVKAEEAEKEAKTVEKAALLARLGLTEDELKTILG